MNRKYFYIILILTVLSLFLIVFFLAGTEPKNQETTQEGQQEIQIDRPPFSSYISGVGIVEPQSGNIAISSPFNRIIEKIYVEINDSVKKGETLFQLYNQDLLSNLRIKERKYESLLSNFRKLEAFPREEDLVIAVETLNKATAVFNEARLQYCMFLKRCSCSNKAEWCMQWYKYQEAIAEFRQAEAQFAKVKAGTWKPELTTAYQDVETAQADIDASRSEIAQTYIKSPIEGTILQLKIHEGETVTPNKPVIIVGNIDELNLRVSIDQYIEELFHSKAEAVAFRQWDHKTEFPLRFLHLEPVMVPKTNLTNELRERVDAHVFEVLYRIEKEDGCLSVGEQMDVYIDVEKKNEGEL